MISCVVLTTSIVDTNTTTDIMASSFYIAARLSCAALNAIAAVIFTKFWRFHTWNVVICALPTVFWFGALFVDYPLNLMVQACSFGLGTNSHSGLMKIGFRITCCICSQSCMAELQRDVNTSTSH
jgi:hypothetical protein